MFARVTTTEFSPYRIDEAIHIVRERSKTHKLGKHSFRGRNLPFPKPDGVHAPQLVLGGNRTVFPGHELPLSIRFYKGELKAVGIFER